MADSPLHAEHVLILQRQIMMLPIADALSVLCRLIPMLKVCHYLTPLEQNYLTSWESWKLHAGLLIMTTINNQSNFKPITDILTWLTGLGYVLRHL